MRSFIQILAIMSFINTITTTPPTTTVSPKKPIITYPVVTKFYLFINTLTKPVIPMSFPIQINVTNNLTNNPYFNPKFQTILVVHGIRANSTFNHLITLRTALLCLASSSNIIMVDWGANSTRATLFDFSLTGNILSQIATNITTLLRANSISASSTYCIGLDMGAHICGLAGKLYGQFARISGLDPFGGPFNSIDATNVNSLRLFHGDAVFIDIIHTSREFGMWAPIADAEFYINKGSRQPNCEDAFCDIQRAVYHFAESLYCQCAFVSLRCLAFDFTLNNCNNFSRNILDMQPMGFYAKTSMIGIFSLTTNKLCPYSLYSSCKKKSYACFTKCFAFPCSSLTTTQCPQAMSPTAYPIAQPYDDPYFQG